MTKLTEAEFLKLPPRQQDAFIKENVINIASILPITQSWDAMRLGVEKANEEGFRFLFQQIEKGRWLTICSSVNADSPTKTTYNESLPLAFWIAYLRALGIIED